MSYLQTNNTIIKNKAGLLNLAQELGNISKACKVMGFSRDTFYRYQNAVEDGGVEALINKSRRGPNRKNRVEPQVEDAVVKLAIGGPISNERRQVGLTVSPAVVRNIWLRHELENMNKRMKALEEKVAKEGIVLTESQLKVMELRR
jgi:transposase